MHDFDVDDDYEDDFISNFSDLTSDFSQKAEDLAIYYIDLFFNNKKLCSGGKIPKKLLHSVDRVSMVLNYDIIRGVDHAYSLLKHTISDEDRAKVAAIGEASEDIKMVMNILNQLSTAGVPQQFAGGMIILYLEFIEGVF